MDLFPKFIIEGDSLLLRKVTFHKEMVKDRSQVKGGGWFRYNPDTNTFTLYGCSEDFGPAKLEDIRECVRSGKVYSNEYKTHTMTDRHKFAYDTQSEIIELPCEAQ